MNGIGAVLSYCRQDRWIHSSLVREQQQDPRLAASYVLQRVREVQQTNGMVASPDSHPLSILKVVLSVKTL